MENIIYRKISIYEMVIFILPFIFITGLLYISYLQSIQMQALQDSVLELSKTVTTLNESIQEKNTQMDLLQRHNSAAKPQNLNSNNEMTQFHIKAVGVCMASLLAYNILSHTFPTIFSLKVLIPTSLYSSIQEYTFFLQENKTFAYLDKKSNINWLIEILNNKYIKKIEVKPSDKEIFIDASKFIKDIMETNTNLINTAATNQGSADLVEKVSKSANINAMPSVFPTDEMINIGLSETSRTTAETLNLISSIL